MKKEVKEMNKTKKLIILGSIIIGLIIIGIVGYFILFKDDENELNSGEVTSTISMLESGEYYIFGAPKNQEFEINKEDGFSYEVIDEENNKVLVIEDAKDDFIVIKPKELYEEGKSYTIKITNGQFTNEELTDAKEVIFSIKREAKQEAILNKDIITINENDIKVTGNNDKITLTSENNYEVGDILYIEKESAYKIEKVNKNNYEVSTPTIEEVFEVYDYYGEEYLNLENIIVDEEMKEYLVAKVEKSLLEYFIPTVSAKTKVSTEIKWDKKKEALVTKVNVSTDPGDKLFKNKFLNSHSLAFEISAEVKVKFIYDIDGNKVDIGFTLETTTRPSIKLTNESIDLQDFRENLNNNINDYATYKGLRKVYDSAKEDNTTVDKTIGTVEVPTGLFGVDAIFDIGLLLDFEIKADASVGLETTTKTTIGYSSKKGFYSSNKQNSEITTEINGKLETKVGLRLQVGIEAFNLAYVKAVVDAGLYGDAEIKFKEKSDSIVIDTELSAGFFIGASAKVKLFNYEATAELFEKKFPLDEYEDSKTISLKEETVSKEEETTQKPETNNNTNNNNNNSSNNNNTTTTPTYKYTAAEVRQKLIAGFKQYAPFGYFENGNSPYSDGCGGSGYIGWCYTTKMNVDSNIFEINNKFGGASAGMEDYIGYTCYYNYVNDTLSCTNYSNAKSKLQSLCQQDYDDYWYYKNQGIDDGDYGYGIVYNTVNECFNYLIGGSDSNKNYYKTRVNKILQYAGLTQSDLGVLK